MGRSRCSTWVATAGADAVGGAAAGGVRASGAGAGAEAATRARRARARGRARRRAMRRRGEAAFFRFFTNPRGQFPEDTNWKDSISTRKRFSVPGEDMRTSNELEPREGTTPKTKARPRLTTRPFSSSPSTPTITRSHAQLAPLRTSPYTSTRPLPTRSVVKLTARREEDRGE